MISVPQKSTNASNIFGNFELIIQPEYTFCDLFKGIKT